MIKLRKKGILVAVAVVFLISLGVFYGIKFNKEKSFQQAAESFQQTADKTIEFINKNLVQEGTTASFVSMIEESGLYKLKVKVGTNEPEVYVTKNGKLLFVQGIGVIDMSLATTTESQTEGQTTGEVIKNDKPDVKLFVMSYCPYGLQAEKMYLPVYNLLKGKADMGVYFVSYAMHEKKEIDENLRQYCIQKEQNDKYYDYLSCFVKADDYEKCLAEAGVDSSKLSTCVSDSDKEYKITELYNNRDSWVGSTCPDGPYCFPPFNVNDNLNTQYGVQGSPTIVINDTVVDVGTRSPEAFKEVICQAFNNAPEECSQALSGDAASISFGEGTAANSASSGSCE